MPRKRLHVGTDCYGTDAPIYALKRTKAYRKGKLALVHEWSCDTNRNAKAFILENHKPHVFYDESSEGSMRNSLRWGSISTDSLASRGAPWAFAMAGKIVG